MSLKAEGRMRMRTIDIHTHGIRGYNTRGATPRDILGIAGIHGSHGVNAIIPTIYSGPIGEMRTDIAAVKKAMEIQAAEKDHSKVEVKGSRFTDNKSEIGNQGWETGNNIEPGILDVEHQFPAPRGLKPAEILGVHLEGPFLNPVRAGALNKGSFLPPDISSLQRLIEGFDNIIKIITVAPELDGAPGLIRSISDAGIIVSMGHSDATYHEAEAGFNAGAKGITHIFNAMRGIHHREPGITGFGLTNPHIYLEVIADPFHLHPKTIELILGAKKPEKIIIVSDSIRTTRTGTGTQNTTDPTSRLLGGSMTIAESVEYLIGLGFQQNIVERCISCNPERYITNDPAASSLL
jgi:N-acetylglucosamine-6-phosphate deacetylase